MSIITQYVYNKFGVHKTTIEQCPEPKSITMEDILSNPNTEVYARTVIAVHKPNIYEGFDMGEIYVDIDIDEPIPCMVFDAECGVVKGTSKRVAVDYRRIHSLNENNLDTLKNKVIKICQIYHPNGIDDGIYRDNEGFTNYIVEVE